MNSEIQKATERFTADMRSLLRGAALEAVREALTPTVGPKVVRPAKRGGRPVDPSSVSQRVLSTIRDDGYGRSTGELVTYYGNAKAVSNALQKHQKAGRIKRNAHGLWVAA